MRQHICLLAMVISAHHFGPSAWGESGAAPHSAGWIASITSENEADRSEARKAALEQRRETIEGLVTIVDRPVVQGEEFYNSSTPRNIAIFLLGRLRAKESVSSLMECIQPREGQSMVIDEEMLLSPAAAALAEIGMPAVQPLVERMKLKGMDPEGQMCLMTMVRILGGDLADTKLAKTIGKETNKEYQKNLQACLDALQKKEIPVEKLEEVTGR